MKYYLSSFNLGDETAKLKKLISQTNMNFGYIANARDYSANDPIRYKQRTADNIKDLEQYGAKVELLDLREYFGKSDKLKSKLNELGGIYVSGGNTFVLRQAMYLSGLDNILLQMQNRNDFLYIAYSAGVCVLTPSLKPYAITDDSTDFPYKELKSQIWDGLGILDFAFEPHYKSDHPESDSTDKEIDWCVQNKILFKAYRDGEVLIIEN